MTDDEFRKLDIASRIAPTSASWPTDQPYVHWTRLTNTGRRRVRVSMPITGPKTRSTAIHDCRMKANGKSA